MVTFSNVAFEQFKILILSPNIKMKFIDRVFHADVSSQ